MALNFFRQVRIHPDSIHPQQLHTLIDEQLLSMPSRQLTWRGPPKPHWCDGSARLARAAGTHDRMTSPPPLPPDLLLRRRRCLPGVRLLQRWPSLLSLMCTAPRGLVGVSGTASAQLGRRPKPMLFPASGADATVCSMTMSLPSTLHGWPPGALYTNGSPWVPLRTADGCSGGSASGTRHIGWRSCGAHEVRWVAAWLRMGDAGR